MCQWNHAYITQFIIEKKKIKKIDAVFQMSPNILGFFSDYKLQLLTISKCTNYI